MKKICTITLVSSLMLVLMSAVYAHAASNEMNGVWSLDSAVCKGEGKAVDQMNSELKAQIPSTLQSILIIDGSTVSFMINDPQPNDPCIILVQGSVSVSDIAVTLTPKYPVSIGAGRCRIDNHNSSVQFRRNGMNLELAGNDNKGVCKEVTYTYTKMGAAK
jgi:hypothetical protein